MIASTRTISTGFASRARSRPPSPSEVAETMPIRTRSKKNTRANQTTTPTPTARTHPPPPPPPPPPPRRRGAGGGAEPQAGHDGDQRQHQEQEEQVGAGVHGGAAERDDDAGRAEPGRRGQADRREQPRELAQQEFPPLQRLRQQVRQRSPVPFASDGACAQRQGDQRRQEQGEVQQAGRRAAEVLKAQAAQILLAQVGEAQRQQREQPAVEQEPPVAEGVADLFLHHRCDRAHRGSPSFSSPACSDASSSSSQCESAGVTRSGPMPIARSASLNAAGAGPFRFTTNLLVGARPASPRVVPSR